MARAWLSTGRHAIIQSSTMNAALLPQNEAERLRALRGFAILDTPREQDFDDFTLLAAEICGTSMALVSLVDEKRQWFKSRRGFEPRETPRELSFCAHAILGREIFEVCDATHDPRFVDNPLVESGQVRFYAGAPLTTEDGHNLGTLSVLHEKPHRLTSEQREALLALARQVMHQIELRRISSRLKQQVRCREFEAALSRLLPSGGTLEHLLATCTSQLAKCFASTAVVWTPDIQSGELRAVAREAPSSTDQSTEAIENRIGREAADRVSRGRTLVVIDDVSQAPWSVSGEGAGNGGAFAFAGFPLLAQGELLGVLALWRARAFTDEEVASLSSVATTLGLAIDVRRADKRLRDLNTELERRVAERASALIESERRHRTLLSHLPGMAYRCRNERGWPADYLSEGSQALIGYPPQALVSGPVKFGDLVHPDDAERVWSEVQSALAQHKPFALEYRVRHANGDYRWISEHGRGIEDEHGKIEYIEGFITDVTARKQGERQALRTQRLESLGTLAGGVAHDLNNALAPILMGLELLRMQPTISDQLTDTMMASARRGADMVRQLLTFARGAEGTRQLVQPRHLLAEMERIVRATFPKNIELMMNYGASLPAVVGDPTQLHQVLLNLCVNARDAMPDGGRLMLEADKVIIDAAFASSVTDAQPGSYVVWRVTDTGSGIPPEIIDRVFEPFFTTKAPEKGTGLGLSTVMGIVRSHGGFVRVESTVGSGTKFSVHLPAAASTQGESAPVEEAPFHGSGEVVLVVEDDPAVRHVSQSVLLALNFKVVLASDGTEALLRAAAFQDQVRIVLTDLNMPHMDGLTFTRVITRMLPHASIIVASGGMDERTEREFVDLGVAAVLHKPFGQDKLVAALRAATRTRATAGN